MEWRYCECLSARGMLLALGLASGCGQDAPPERDLDAGGSQPDSGLDTAVDPTGGLELVVEPGEAGSPVSVEVRTVEPIEGVFGFAFHVVYEPADAALGDTALDRTRQLLKNALRVESETVALARRPAPGTLALGATLDSPARGEVTLGGTLASVELTVDDGTQFRAHLERVSIRGADGRFIFPESAP